MRNNYYKNYNEKYYSNDSDSDSDFDIDSDNDSDNYPYQDSHYLVLTYINSFGNILLSL